MSNKLENAKKLYLEGIRDGNPDVVNKYSGARYTQHSTGVEDGPEGFQKFFTGFLQRTTDRDIRIIRTIEDGRYVFLHVFQDIDKGTAQWVTADMFDTDENDKLIEHWDVIAAYKDPSQTAYGNDVIFGDFEIKDQDKTEANKILVRKYLTDVFQNKNHHAITQYISSYNFIQHNADLPNGIEAMKDLLAKGDVQYDFIFKLIGQGNYVVSYSKVIAKGDELAVFDIFRIEDGKIVEHWDNIEPIPPRNEWANTGKF